MTVVSRTIRSVPYRSAAETWNVIVDLLAPKDGEARKELQAVMGTACSLISEETMTDSPMVVYGSGPRVKIYCLYNDAALEGDKASEGALAFNATEKDWNMSIPSPEPDLAWVQKALKAKSTRVTARDQADKVEEADAPDASVDSTLSLDKGAFLKL